MSVSGILIGSCVNLPLRRWSWRNIKSFEGESPERGQARLPDPELFPGDLGFFFEESELLKRMTRSQVWKVGLPPLFPDELQDDLASEMLIPKILRFDSLPSTNVEAAKLAGEGAAEGVCVVAGEQTAGRGRLERQWISPPGAGLYFSIILRPKFPQARWPLLTLMSAVAVHDALLESCGLTTDIKWPNDVLVNEKKLCGILAETVQTRSGRAVVVGIGINLARGSFPPELAERAISVEDLNEQKPDVDAILPALVNSLDRYYQVLQQQTGPDETIRAWCARSSYDEGKRVQITESNASFVGTTQGLTRDGALRVKTDDGELRTIRAGDVSLVRPIG